MMTVRTPACVCCGKESEMQVDPNGYREWQGGTLIQVAFPSMTADEREMLVTGTHPACWEKMFGDSGPLEEDAND